MKWMKKICISLAMMALVVGTAWNAQSKEVEAASYASATNLPMSGDWTSNLYFTKSDDREQWYKVNITTDGALNLKVMNCGEHTVYWELYTADLSKKLMNESIYPGSETSPKAEKWSISLKTGTYYLKMAVWNSDEGIYRMCNSFTAYNVNDMDAYSYDSPQEYIPESKITGGLGNADEEDWFKFTVSKKTTYILKMSMYWDEGGLQWSLKNWDLTREIDNDSLYGGTETSPASHKWEITLDAGTYYFQTSKYNGSGGKYTFIFNKLTQQNCEHSYNISWHDATYFAKGYRLYKCEKCGYSYKSDYEPVKVLSQGYLYNWSQGQKGALQLNWSSVTDASGYQVRYSTDRSMQSNVVVKTIAGSSSNSKRIAGLSRKKKYYVQVRAYKKSGGRVVYGKWSVKKCLKTQ